MSASCVVRSRRSCSSWARITASCFASKCAGRVLLGLGAGSTALRTGVGLVDRLVGAGTGGSTAPDPLPFLGDFLATGSFAGGFTAAGFFATGFFAVGFFAVAFLAEVFLEVVLFELALFRACFFALGFFDPLFAAADFRAALFAADFLTVFLAVLLTGFFAEDLLGVAFFFLEDAVDELLFRVEGFRAGLMGAGR